jgi:hypothetical protein
MAKMKGEKYSPFPLSVRNMLSESPFPLGEPFRKGVGAIGAL